MAEEDDDITSEIYNLTVTLVTLDEIDTALMDRGRQKKLREMKEQIFDVLAKRIDKLE